MKRLLIIIPIISLFLVSCQNEMDKAEWLIGNWEHTSEEGKFTEKWKKKSSKTFIGNSYFVIENDTVFSERVNLVQRGKDLFYIVEITTEPSARVTEFKLTSNSANQLVFENPENDFPKKITYNRIHKDSLFAEISGGGNPQGFPMKRSK